jgi:hypothetical protein
MELQRNRLDYEDPRIRQLQPVACARSGLARVLAAQRYLTSSPVTARPMIIRWISLVPPKIVKLSDVATGD